MAAYIRFLLVPVCCTVRQSTAQINALPVDGVTITPKHVGAVLI